MLNPMAHKPNLKPQAEVPVPQKAIVLYGHDDNYQDSTSQYATIHDIKNGQMQAGRLTDIANIRRTISRRANKSVNQPAKVDLRSLIAPDNVLVDTPNLLVWHTPKQKRDMWFNVGKQTPLKVWWPSLVFAVNPGSNFSALTVYAKATNQRPSTQTKLYHAPLMNISGGSLCQGGARVPAKRDFTTLNEMEDTLFDSYFTHTNYRTNRFRSYYLDNRQHVQFWQDKEKADAQVKAGEMHFAGTFGEWLTKHAQGIR
ncbi:MULTISPECIES: PRTRC system protein B [Salinimonas]|uniref:PRTRC system protein B n=2 Tax=Salinimonas TaxID=288793 RepID=A0A5B7YJ13_9ALTE|nr:MULTISPECIES: PRTRC system protein B [Salinimonas]MBD3587526.1 PRTRC system protein B [Salinimonas profundi]QCZ95561.1 PRTRC system protein B [Salinimonas iocasae]